jgi:hypothetical protein
VDIPRNVWNKVEALEAGGLECKVGAVVEHEVEGILEVKAAIKQEESKACLGYPEREQSRLKVKNEE